MGTTVTNRAIWYAASTSSSITTYNEAHTHLLTNVSMIFNNNNVLRFKGEFVMPVSVSSSHIIAASRFYVQKNATVTFSVLSPISATTTMFVKNNTTNVTNTYTLTGSANTYINRSISVTAQHDYTVIFTQNGGTVLFIKTSSTDEIYPYINAYTLKSALSSSANTNASSLTGTLSSSVLPSTGVLAGTYGTLSNIPIVTVDSTGRVTDVTVTSSVSSTLPPPLYIKDGYVGIGSTQPSVALQVNGDIVASNLTGTLTADSMPSPFTISAGNVGISTTPGSKFHVFGTTILTATGSHGTARTVVQLNTPDSTTGTTAQLDFTQSTATTGRIANIFEGAGKIGIAFSTYNASLGECMRIANDGNVGIGTNNPLSKLAVSGNIVASGDIGGFGTVSDARLKTNIKPLDSGIEVIKQLKPVVYTWKDDIFNEEKRGADDAGFIAQEVETVLPQVIRELKFPTAPDTYKGIAYEKIVPYLVQAVQELSTEVSRLKAILDG